MYADDVVVFSPCTAGLQQLLKYGVVHDMKFNAEKSAVMICRIKQDKCLMFPSFKLPDNNLRASNNVKYLGHFITDMLKDDEDIYRQCRTLYAQANSLFRKFGACTDYTE